MLVTLFGARYAAAAPAAVSKKGETPAKTQDKKVFPADAIKIVDVATERGDIYVVGADRLTVQVELIKAVDSPKKCKVTMETDSTDRALHLSVKSTGFFKEGDCVTGFRVELPKRSEVLAKSGTGDIDASDLAGPLLAQSGTGDIRLSAVRGAVKANGGTGEISGDLPTEKAVSLKTGTGAIRLSGLAGALEAQTGTGELRLEWAKTMAKDFKGRVRVKTGTGNAAAYFPAGSAVHAELKSATGKLVNELGDTAGAGFVLAMESGTGRLAVLKTKSK